MKGSSWFRDCNPVVGCSRAEPRAGGRAVLPRAAGRGPRESAHAGVVRPEALLDVLGNILMLSSRQNPEFCD